MTRERCKELLPVMQAWAEGRTVQCRISIHDTWDDCEMPQWHDNNEYRIKPEPRSWWIVVYDDAQGHIAYRSEEHAHAFIERTGRQRGSSIVHVVEDPP